MKIAYFTNQYPKVSHSFIRREIRALEGLGFEILRFSIRSDPGELVDKADIEEQAKTRFILNEKPAGIISAFFLAFFHNPAAFFRAAMLAVRIGQKSKKGMLRHLIYFVEACVLLRLLRREKVDYLHAHFGTNSTTVAMLARVMGGPCYSFTVHGPEEFDSPESLSITKKIKHSAQVIAISSFGRSQLYRWCPYEEWRKVKVIRCCVEGSFLTAELSKITDQPRFICVGRLCEQKGQLLLLDAVGVLKGEGIEVKVVLAGDGPMRPEVEKRIRDLNIADNVDITGWLSGERVREEIERSRALLLPSFAEGLPVVIMEALALGRPVITTYIAGIPELVENEVNGWLVVAGSVESLVAAMKKSLSSQPEQLMKMGSAGRDAVSRLHNSDIEAKKLAGLFIHALNNTTEEND